MPFPKLLQLVFPLALCTILFYSCEKNEELAAAPQNTLPTVTTSPVTVMARDSAVGGGNVTDSGSAAIIERGICWSSAPGPTTSSNKTIEGNSTGPFTSVIRGLDTNTVYYVRAYASNAVGTAYGNEVTFRTNALGKLVKVLRTYVSWRDSSLFEYDANGRLIKELYEGSSIAHGRVLTNVSRNIDGIITGFVREDTWDTINAVITYDALQNSYLHKVATKTNAGGFVRRDSTTYEYLNGKIKTEIIYRKYDQNANYEPIYKYEYSFFTDGDLNRRERRTWTGGLDPWSYLSFRRYQLDTNVNPFYSPDYYGIVVGFNDQEVGHSHIYDWTEASLIRSNITRVISDGSGNYRNFIYTYDDYRRPVYLREIIGSGYDQHHYFYYE